MVRTILLCFALCSFISCFVVIASMMLGKATEISTMPSGALLAIFDEHYKTNYTSWRGCDGLWTCTEAICEMAKTSDISFIGVSPTDVLANPAPDGWALRPSIRVDDLIRHQSRIRSSTANGTDCSLGILYTIGWITSYRLGLAGFIVIGVSVAFEVMTLCVFCVTVYTTSNGNAVSGSHWSSILFGILAVLSVSLMTAGHGLYYGFIFYWHNLTGDLAPIYVIIGQLVASICMIVSLIVSHVFLVMTYCSEIYSIDEAYEEISSSAN